MLKRTKDWWKGAVIYQIYPRSFKDSNGDGIGDLNGITQELDYIKSLGVDAIWISPFFKSPMRDFGYDVADYCDIDPTFGTLDDCARMIEEAHKRDLKIIIDLVLSHTSDEHDWFKESCKGRDNPKGDWYVWADPKPDGSPPNNWNAFFGGPSWTYNVRRGQYYMHNFLSSQPDLNFHNPDVRSALLDVVRFWLDMGVDGFRLDVAMNYYHNQNLKDNPPNPNPKPAFFNIDFPTPFSMQIHENDVDIPKTLAFMEDLRALLDQYDGRMTVAEIGGERGIEISAAFTAGDKRLHTAYNFSLISGTKASAAFIVDALEKAASQPGDPWPSWAFSNHDVVRVASRWGNAKTKGDPRFPSVLNAALCAMRGSAFLYQGDELGLSDAVIPFEQLQDPWGIFLYPEWQGRDGCRTPMPWDDNAPAAGFSASPNTWLPVPDEHRALSVARQKDDARSTLNMTRAFLQWRKHHPALIRGGERHDRHERDDILRFIRTHEDGDMICIFNLGGDALDIALPDGVVPGNDLFDAGEQTGRLNADRDSVHMPAFGIYCAVAGKI